MIFETLTAEHVAKIRPLANIHEGFELTAEFALDLEQLGGMAAVRSSGDVIAIAGILPRWDGVGMAWAWLSRDWRSNARLITNKMIEMLDASGLHRIEMAVLVGFDRGHSWAKTLGFEIETPCAVAWGPDKRDYSIYRRLNNG